MVINNMKIHMYLYWKIVEFVGHRGIEFTKYVDFPGFSTVILLLTFSSHNLFVDFAGN